MTDVHREAKEIDFSTDRLPWFKFYPTDFMGDGRVMEMTAAERGIFVSLLCHAWTRGSIPADPERAAHICGTDSAGMRAAWPVVRPMFVESDGRLTHPELEKQRAAALEVRAKKRKAGRLGGQASAKTQRKVIEGGEACAPAGAETLAGADGEAIQKPEARSQKPGHPEDSAAYAAGHAGQVGDRNELAGPIGAEAGLADEDPPEVGDTAQRLDARLSRGRSQLMPLVREVAYAPDGKPPRSGDDRRDAQIIGEFLASGRRVYDIEDAIRGAGLCRDQGSEGFARGEKFTLRRLKKGSSTDPTDQVGRFAHLWRNRAREGRRRRHDAPMHIGEIGGRATK